MDGSAQAEVEAYKAARGHEYLVGPLDLISLSQPGLAGDEVKEGIAMPHYVMTLAQVSECLLIGA
jgi:hypothetical protein